jgi:hypothetical protein
MVSCRREDGRPLLKNLSGEAGEAMVTLDRYFQRVKSLASEKV